MLSPSRALLLSLHHLYLMNDVQNAYHYITKCATHFSGGTTQKTAWGTRPM